MVVARRSDISSAFPALPVPWALHTVDQHADLSWVPGKGILFGLGGLLKDDESLKVEIMG